MISNPACDKILAWLSDYLDLEVDETVCLQVKRHLAECPACRQAADGLERTIALCRGEASARPRPLSAGAHDELERAWRKALAGRLPGSR